MEVCTALNVPINDVYKCIFVRECITRNRGKSCGRFNREYADRILSGEMKDSVNDPSDIESGGDIVIEVGTCDQ